MGASGDTDFTGKGVLVVGGSSGIGNAIACAFRDRGARVCLTGTRPTAEAYGETADFAGMDYHRLDVRDHDQLANFAPAFAPAHVVLCQGIAPDDGGDPLSLEVFDQVVDVNLRSMIALAAQVRKGLTEQGGSLTFIGSGACFVAVPHRPAYSASKGGMLTLMRSLAVAWASDDVRVNGIAPGYVATRINEARWQDPAAYRAVADGVPMKRWGEPAEIAGVALFLASPLATYVTGQMIVADGGFIL